MISRRFFISGIITTAAVASASQYIPAMASEPQLYATVYGVGWDLEVIEHHIYEPMSVAHFGGTPDIDKFREVTAFVHAFPVKPMPKPRRMYGWHMDSLSDQLKRFDRPVTMLDNGFTNIVGYQKMDQWRKAQRPDLEFRGKKWMEIQVKAEKENEVYWGDQDV